MYARAVAFEKQHGDRAGIEDVIVGERRFQYEEEVAANPYNYDTWFDYARLEENAGDPDKIREVNNHVEAVPIHESDGPSLWLSPHVPCGIC